MGKAELLPSGNSQKGSRQEKCLRRSRCFNGVGQTKADEAGQGDYSPIDHNGRKFKIRAAPVTLAVSKGHDDKDTIKKPQPQRYKPVSIGDSQGGGIGLGFNLEA